MKIEITEQEIKWVSVCLALSVLVFCLMLSYKNYINVEAYKSTMPMGNGIKK